MANLPRGDDIYRALLDVRSMVHRLSHPFWMPDVALWRWKRPDGMVQGFGPTAPEHPGRANLLWLAMDLERPPREYDASANQLYTSIMMLGTCSKLNGAPLLDLAAMLPLVAFAALLPEQAPPDANTLEKRYPLLRILALRRISYAHT